MCVYAVIVDCFTQHFMLDFKRTTMDVNASYITDLKPLLHESYDIEESIRYVYVYVCLCVCLYIYM